MRRPRRIIEPSCFRASSVGDRGPPDDESHPRRTGTGRSTPPAVSGRQGRGRRHRGPGRGRAPARCRRGPRPERREAGRCRHRHAGQPRCRGTLVWDSSPHDRDGRGAPRRTRGWRRVVRSCATIEITHQPQLHCRGLGTNAGSGRCSAGSARTWGGGSARRDLNIAIPRRWSSLPVAAGQDAACSPQRLLELGQAARHFDLEEHLVDLALQPRQHSGPVVATRL